MLSRRHTLRAISSAALVTALPIKALAHRQKTTLSQIEWDEIEKTLYITHSYHMHDAETALAAVGVLRKPDLTSLRARAKLALYTDEQFKLSQSGKEIALEILGADYEARTVYVYQQVILDAAPSHLTVSAAMLREIIPGQINNVDLTLGTDIKSIQFKGGDGPKKVLA